jgi:hypothetical protein
VHYSIDGAAVNSTPGKEYAPTSSAGAYSLTISCAFSSPSISPSSPCPSTHPAASAASAANARSSPSSSPRCGPLRLARDQARNPLLRCCAVLPPPSATGEGRRSSIGMVTRPRVLALASMRSIITYPCLARQTRRPSPVHFKLGGKIAPSPVGPCPAHRAGGPPGVGDVACMPVVPVDGDGEQNDCQKVCAAPILLMCALNPNVDLPPRVRHNVSRPSADRDRAQPGPSRRFSNTGAACFLCDLS